MAHPAGKPVESKTQHHLGKAFLGATNISQGLQSGNPESKPAEKDVPLTLARAIPPKISTPSEKKSLDDAFKALREEHHTIAQEFRRKGHNSQVPQFDGHLLDSLEKNMGNLAEAMSSESWAISSESWNGTAFTDKDFDALERKLKELTPETFQAWINKEVKKTPARQEKIQAEKEKLGSRDNAQSLARRLASSVEALCRVTKILGEVPPNKLADNLVRQAEEGLVKEISEALSQARGTKQEPAEIQLELEALIGEDKNNWTELRKSAVVSLAASRYGELHEVMESAKQELSKATEKGKSLGKKNKEAAEFLNQTIAFLKRFINSHQQLENLLKTQAKSQKFTSIENEPKDEKSIREKSQKLAGELGLSTVKIGLEVKNYGQKAYGGADAALKKAVAAIGRTPSKIIGATQEPSKERAVADSVLRAALWQMEQPAITLERASRSLSHTLKELAKVEHELADVQSEINIDEQQAGTLPDIVAKKLVHESSNTKRQAKLAAMKELLSDNVERAIKAINEAIGAEKVLSGKVGQLLNEGFGSNISDEVRPRFEYWSQEIQGKIHSDVIKELKATAERLQRSVMEASGEKGSFSIAAKHAELCTLKAMSLKLSLSNIAEENTQRQLDDNSRGARLAKYVASQVKDQLGRDVREKSAPTPKYVHQLLKDNGLLDGTTTDDDPSGYLLATRTAGELESIWSEEKTGLSHLMTPEAYAKVQKSFIEFLVSWSQKRLIMGLPRLVFDIATDAAGGLVLNAISPLYRLPMAAFRIPYKTLKADSFILPGQDIDYKARNKVLATAMKQELFKLATSVLPSTMKTVAAAPVALAGLAYNSHISGKEDTVEGVHGRLLEGKASKKLRVDSPTSMIAGAAIETGLEGAAEAIPGKLQNAGMIPGSQADIRDEQTLALEDVERLLHELQQELVTALENLPAEGERIEPSEVVVLEQEVQHTALSEAMSQIKKEGESHSRRKRSLPDSPREQEGQHHTQLPEAMSQIKEDRESFPRRRRSLPDSPREVDKASFERRIVSFIWDNEDVDQHMRDPSKDPEFMPDFREIKDGNFNMRLAQLGLTRDQVNFVNLYFSEDGAGTSRRAKGVHNVGTYAVKNNDNSYTFFSTMDDASFTVKSWGDATRQINDRDRDSQLARWMRNHTSVTQQDQYNHDYYPDSFWGDNSHLKLDLLTVHESHFDRQNKIWLQHFYPHGGRLGIEDYLYASSMMLGSNKTELSNLLEIYTNPAIPLTADVTVYYQGSSSSEKVPLIRFLSPEFDKNKIDSSRSYVWSEETSFTRLELDRLQSLYLSMSRRDEIEADPQFLLIKNQFDQAMQGLPESQRKSIQDLVEVNGQFMSLYDFIKASDNTFNEDTWPRDIEMENLESVASLFAENRDLNPETIGVIERIRLQNRQDAFKAKLSAYSRAALPLHGNRILDKHFREILSNHGVSNPEDYSLDDKVIRKFQPDYSSGYSNARMKYGDGVPKKPLPEPIYTEFRISDLLRNANEATGLFEAANHRLMKSETWMGGAKYKSSLLDTILKADTEGWWQQQPTSRGDTWQYIKSELVRHGAKSVDDVEFLKIKTESTYYFQGQELKALSVYKVTCDDGTIKVFSVGNDNVDWTFENERDFEYALSAKSEQRALPSHHSTAVFTYKNDKIRHLFSHSSTVPRIHNGYKLESIALDSGGRDYKYLEAKDALKGGVYNLDKLVKSDDEISSELTYRAVSAALVVGSIAAAPFSGGASLGLGMSAAIPHFVNAANADTEEEAASHAAEGLWTVVGEVVGYAAGKAAKPLISKIASTLKSGGRSAAKALSASDDFGSPAATTAAQSMKVKGDWDRFVDIIADFVDDNRQAYRAKRTNPGALAARYASDQSLASAEITRKGVCWDTVYRFEYMAGKISKRELADLSHSTCSFSWRQKFLGDNPVEIKSLEDLSTLPPGSRIAFEEHGQLKHAMLSADGGRVAYGANNGYIGNGPGWEKIDLEGVLNQQGDGFKLASTNRPVKIWSSKAPAHQDVLLEPSAVIPKLSLAGDEVASAAVKSARIKVMGDVKYGEFVGSPGEKCEAAAMHYKKLLAQEPGYSNVYIGELGIWPNAQGMGTNHYVVFATKDGVETAIDVTRGQFDFLPAGDTVTTSAEWFRSYQAAFADKPRTLVKFARVESSPATSAFSANSMRSAFDHVEGATVLNKPSWFNKGNAAHIRGPAVQERPTAPSSLDTFLQRT